MTEVEIYTEAQATDEAVLMFIRKLRRLHPDAYADVIGKLGQGLRDALSLADNRADALRSRDAAAGITRRAMTIWERAEGEIALGGDEE